jgi:hypothetical protein
VSSIRVTAIERVVRIVARGGTGVATINVEAPLASTGGSTPTLSIAPATQSTPGSLSAADKAKLDALADPTLSDALPAPLGNAGPGSSTRAARGDHVHAHGAQAGGGLHATATTGAAGFMSAADKQKLNGIAANAQVNVPTNLGVGGTGDARTITSSTGSAAALPLATTNTAGLLSSFYFTLLSNFAANVRDQVLNMLQQGTNVTLTPSGTGASRTLTISASGTGGGGSGTVTSVQASGGSTGLTFSGGPITGAGTLTLGGTLGIANGGTGATTAEAARAALGAGTGTVTNVGLSLPAIFSVSSSPVTSSGTITASLATQAANRVWAGPSTGADAAPTFRALTATDIPGLPVAKIRNAQEQRLFGSAQFVDSEGSGQLIELVGTGFVWGPGALALSENLQAWSDIDPDEFVGGSAVRTITAGFDGGRVSGVDQALTTGLRFELRATTGLDPTAWTLLPKAGSTGNITVEVRKRPFASGTFTAITAGSPPSISSGARGTGSASAWTAIDDGDLIEIEVTSVTGTVTGITLIIEATEA